MSQKVSPELVRFMQWPGAGYEIRIERVNGEDVRVVAPRMPWSKINFSERKRFFFRSNQHVAAEFSKVENEIELKNFCERYGEIGYRLQRQALPVKGDPVTWCLRHSQIVAGLVSVMAFVQEIRIKRHPLDDSSAPYIAASLQQVFNSFGVEGPHRRNSETRQQSTVSTRSKLDQIGSSRPSDEMYFEYDQPSPFTHHVTCGSVSVENWINNPLDGANRLIQRLINPMIGGFHLELIIDESSPVSSPLALQLVGDSLIAAIYWQVAESMGGKLRSCKRCLRVFPASGKQQFCSPSCMNRVKCLRYRTSQQK